MVVETKPGPVGEHVAAEPQGHHEEPGLAGHAAVGVVAPAGVAEVDLRDLARRRLHADDHVGGDGSALRVQALTEALHRREAAVVVGILKPQVVVDGRGARSSPTQLVDLAPPRLDGGGLCWGGGGELPGGSMAA